MKTSNENSNIRRIVTEPPERQKIRRKNRKAMMALFVALIVAATIFAVMLNRDNPTFRAFFSGVDFEVETTENGMLELNSTDRYFFGSNKDGVIVAQSNQVTALSPKLEPLWQVDVAGVGPVVKTRGAYTLVYYTESGEAAVIHKKKSMPVAADGVVLLGEINQDGYFLLVTREKGFKAQITVYSPEAEVLYRWHSADTYVVDADISFDNRSIAVATTDFSKGTVSGGLMLFNFTQEKPYAGLVLEGNMVLDVCFTGRDELLLVGDTACAEFNLQGEKKWEYSYEGKGLTTFDVEQDNIVLALHEGDAARADHVIQIVTNGKRKGEYTCSGNVKVTDAVNGDILLVQDRKLILISERGNEIHSVNLNRDIKNAVLFADRKHAFVVSGTAAEVVELK